MTPHFLLQRWTPPACIPLSSQVHRQWLSGVPVRHLKSQHTPPMGGFLPSMFPTERTTFNSRIIFPWTPFLSCFPILRWIPPRSSSRTTFFHNAFICAGFVFFHEGLLAIRRASRSRSSHCQSFFAVLIVLKRAKKLESSIPVFWAWCDFLAADSQSFSKRRKHSPR